MMKFIPDLVSLPSISDPPELLHTKLCIHGTTRGPLPLRPARQYMAEALSIAISLDTPACDALFIAQARSDHTTLVTADRHQARCAEKCGGAAVLVQEIFSGIGIPEMGFIGYGPYIIVAN